MLLFYVFLRFLIILLFISNIALAQWPGLNIRKATSKITVDGVMDEVDWQTADVANRFKQYFPFDSSYSKVQTEVRMTYDDHYIYLFAIMHNLEPRNYITPSLRRDFRGEANDAFVLVLDTYRDNTNAFQFGVNPFGVQREGLVSNGGSDREDLSLNWDNKWFSEAKIGADHWVCEMAIPFKSVRFKEGASEWNINFYRIDSHTTERSTWAPVPRANILINLAFLRKLHWDRPLQKPGGNVSLIPFAASKITHDFEEGTPRSFENTIGGDAKIAVSSALNLDLTVNPDFSQVEVDQQVTNLDRFEIFFPERRQFFLENADLFGSFGNNNSRPFFSRRIGVTSDPSTGQNIQNPIYGGARLSGKINNNWRLGVLDMQAAEDEAINLPSTNYAVAALQRKIFSRSNVGLMMINKQSFDTTAYNRLIGLDYNLASKDSKWTGKFFYHRSFDNGKKDSTYSTAASLDYILPNYTWSLLYQDIGANFNPEVGYVKRKRYKRFAPKAFYSFYSKSKVINNHGPGFDIDYQWNDLYNTTDWDANLWYRIKFQNTATFYTRLRRDYVYLFSPFDPSGSEGLDLGANTGYYWNSVIIGYTSDARRKLYFDFQSRFGEYYNGYRQNIDGTLSYRFQPYAILSMDFSYNHITLPEPYNSSDLVLLGPKFDFTFSRKVFWTTYVQYNNQINNVNINSRLQWRFRPVSDLFLVYTDNYFAESFENGEIFYVGAPKFRSLVLKFTYWLNL
ncbi:MAG: carbohydrate binding family 9 domain-containing protein [Bacteroidia bacterium]|nr:carbohydrate binding family 9 domain-containing protein [Bacteroidia bacterium]